MSKIFGFLFLLAAVVSVSSGVVEISIHPDRLSAIPGFSGKVNLPAGNITGRLSQWGTEAKRSLELFLAESPDKKAELSLGYVEADIQRLQDHFSSKADPETIIADGNLLVSSLQRAQQYTEHASPEKLAESKERSESLMADAGDTLAHIKKLEDEFNDHQQQLQTVADALGTFVKDTTQEGQVAGAHDEATNDSQSTESETSATKIPLNF